MQALSKAPARAQDEEEHHVMSMAFDIGATDRDRDDDACDDRDHEYGDVPMTPYASRPRVRIRSYRRGGKPSTGLGRALGTSSSASWTPPAAAPELAIGKVGHGRRRKRNSMSRSRSVAYDLDNRKPTANINRAETKIRSNSGGL